MSLETTAFEERAGRGALPVLRGGQCDNTCSTEEEMGSGGTTDDEEEGRKNKKHVQWRDEPKGLMDLFSFLEVTHSPMEKCRKREMHFLLRSSSLRVFFSNVFFWVIHSCVPY